MPDLDFSLGDILSLPFKATPPVERRRDFIIGIEDKERIGYIIKGEKASVRIHEKERGFSAEKMLEKIDRNFDEHVKKEELVVKRVCTSRSVKFYTYMEVKTRDAIKRELKKCIGEGKWHRIIIWDDNWTMLGFSSTMVVIVLSEDAVSFFAGEPLKIEELRGFLEGRG
jgi:hypothetical protein